MLLQIGHFLRTSFGHPYFAQLVVRCGYEKSLSRFCRGSNQLVRGSSGLASSNEVRGVSEPAFHHPEHTHQI